jgi:hypothetical protein
VPGDPWTLVGDTIVAMKNFGQILMPHNRVYAFRLVAAAPTGSTS